MTHPTPENTKPDMPDEIYCLNGFYYKPNAVIDGASGMTATESGWPKYTRADLSPQTVPAGWKMVPIEPTEEMAQAEDDVCPATFDKRYKAMLAVTPEPPPQNIAAGDDPRICDLEKLQTVKECHAEIDRLRRLAFVWPYGNPPMPWKIVADDLERRLQSPQQGGVFKIGDRVQKKSGSAWHGVVCGFYKSRLTIVGYAVESEREPGSVQIYPEAALERAAKGGE